MHPLQSCCQCGSKGQGSSRGAGKAWDVPWLTAQHPHEMPTLLQSITCVVPILSQSDWPSPAWACQICFTHAMRVCTFISGMPEVPRQCISIKSDWTVGTLTGMSKHWRKCLAEANVSCPQLLICNISLLDCRVVTHLSPVVLVPSVVVSQICCARTLFQVLLHNSNTQIFGDWFY